MKIGIAWGLAYLPTAQSSDDAFLAESMKTLQEQESKPHTVLMQEKMQPYKHAVAFYPCICARMHACRSTCCVTCALWIATAWIRTHLFRGLGISHQIQAYGTHEFTV